MKHSTPPAPTCAALSRQTGEPQAATAPHAPTWLLIEQPGPWGSDAVTNSQLGTSRSLQHQAQNAGVRIALIRRPGRTPQPSTRLC
ncbi:hypothetical protein [Streptomyces sp. NPDC057909]|uniref:hypothetical protein n=1 Tax=Streptomyces sp. NPDC057909 TaxID=3346277 RepID=UPI0036E74362